MRLCHEHMKYTVTVTPGSTVSITSPC